MPLPDERKGAAVSSLIQMFKEKERLAQTDPAKLKPRPSLEPPLAKQPKSSLAVASGSLATANTVEASADLPESSGTPTLPDSVAANITRLSADTKQVLRCIDANPSASTMSPPAAISKEENETVPPRPGSVDVKVSGGATTTKPTKPPAMAQPAKTQPAKTNAAASKAISARPGAGKLTPSNSSSALGRSDKTPSKAPDQKTPTRRAGFMAPTASSAARAANASPATTKSSHDAPKTATSPAAGRAKASSSTVRSPRSSASALSPVSHQRQTLSPSPTPSPSRSRLSNRTESAKKAGVAFSPPQRTRKLSDRVDTAPTPAMDARSGSHDPALPAAEARDKPATALLSSPGAHSSTEVAPLTERAASQTEDEAPSESGQSVGTYGGEDSTDSSEKIDRYASSRATSTSDSEASGPIKVEIDAVLLTAMSATDREKGAPDAEVMPQACATAV